MDKAGPIGSLAADNYRSLRLYTAAKPPPFLIAHWAAQHLVYLSNESRLMLRITPGDPKSVAALVSNRI